MKKLTIFVLALICWHAAQSQAPVWGLQVSTFPIFTETGENFLSASFSEANTILTPHCIEPGLVLSWESQKNFHNVVFNPLSKTITNLNILIGKHADYYCFFSYSPAEKLWYSSVGISKSFEVSKGSWVTPYAEWGFDSFNPKSCLIEVGVVYGIELGPIQFKKHHKNKKTQRRDYS